MRVTKCGGVLCVLGVLLGVLREAEPRPQDAGFELPVELVGFPVIIGAVRLSNFVKKLAYSLNPGTYQGGGSRSRRDTEEMLNMAEAEKRLVEKFGEGVCIYRRVCLHYASRPRGSQGEHQPLEWADILTQYKSSPDRNKEYHLLSVFLGDIVGSPRFCSQLAKRRSCQE